MAALRCTYVVLPLKESGHPGTAPCQQSGHRSRCPLAGSVSKSHIDNMVVSLKGDCTSFCRHCMKFGHQGLPDSMLAAGSGSGRAVAAAAAIAVVAVVGGVAVRVVAPLPIVGPGNLHEFWHPCGSSSTPVPVRDPSQYVPTEASTGLIRAC